jgi:YHS domain-containing protein
MAIETDPVCGMQVDTETTDLKYEHDGTTYWFCKPRLHCSTSATTPPSYRTRTTSPSM